MGSALSHLNVPSSAATYSAALEGLVGVDEVILRRNPEMPHVYGAGVRYGLKGHNIWRYPHEMIGDGWGDCEGLSCWRTAELRVSGADPDARVMVYRTGPRKWHAVVGRGDGWVEDPSIVCGMREKVGMPWTVREVLERERPWPRESMMVVGAIDDAFNDAFLPSFDVVKHGDGYTGVLKLPMADGKNALIANTSLSKSQSEAVQKGQNITRDLTAVLAADPYALAELNPYSATAVKALGDPDVQAVAKGVAAQSKKESGVLAKPGDLLESPEITRIVSKLGPYGAIAAGIISNPVARGIRQASHSVFKKIPGLGKLF